MWLNLHTDFKPRTCDFCGSTKRVSYYQIAKGQNVKACTSCATKKVWKNKKGAK